jgi:hypothetical protein
LYVCIIETRTATESIAKLVQECRKQEFKRQQRLEVLSDDIDEAIFEAVGITKETREDIKSEIFLRTSNNPEDREVPTRNPSTKSPTTSTSR